MIIASNPVPAHDHEPHDVQAAVQRQKEEASRCEFLA